METKQIILKESWKLYQNSTKTSEKLVILKAIEKTSDELPEVVWKVNHYGYEIKYTKERRKRYNKLNQEEEIALAKNGQDSRLE